MHPALRSGFWIFSNNDAGETRETEREAPLRLGGSNAPGLMPHRQSQQMQLQPAWEKVQYQEQMKASWAIEPKPFPGQQFFSFTKQESQVWVDPSQARGFHQPNNPGCHPKSGLVS